MNTRIYSAILPLILLSFIAWGLTSCEPSTKENNTILPENSGTKDSASLVTWTLLDTTYSSGDCGRRKNSCLSIRLQYPVFSGEDTAASYLNRELDAQLTSLLLGAGPDLQATSLKEVVNELMNYYASIHEHYTKEPRWTIAVNSDAVIPADSFLSLNVTVDLFTGGAHPNSFTQLSSYALRKPRRLSLEEVVTDTLALEHVAEELFRRDKQLDKAADLESEGFLFEEGKFRLNRNFQLTAEGLLFFFNSYEIAAYAYGPTELLIPYARISSALQPEIRKTFIPDAGKTYASQ